MLIAKLTLATGNKPERLSVTAVEGKSRVWDKRFIGRKPWESS